MSITCIRKSFLGKTLLRNSVGFKRVTQLFTEQFTEIRLHIFKQIFKAFVDETRV